MKKFWLWMDKKHYGTSCSFSDNLKEEWPDKYIINHYYDCCPVKFEEIPKNILIGFMIEYLIENHKLKTFRSDDIEQVFSDLVFEIEWCDKEIGHLGEDK